MSRFSAEANHSSEKETILAPNTEVARLVDDEKVVSMRVAGTGIVATSELAAGGDSPLSTAASEMICGTILTSIVVGDLLRRQSGRVDLISSTKTGIVSMPAGRNEL